MDFDEIRRRTIVALFSDDALFDELVLKGGNAISLIYGFGHRASLDLDFSIEKDFADIPDTERRIVAALQARFGEVGYTVFDTKFGARPMRERAGANPRWGGYQLEFKLIEKSKEARFAGDMQAIRRNALVIGPDQMRRFVVDFSKYEFCGGKVEWELENYTIYVYTPQMIVLEKLRAICQQMPEYQPNPNKRARARDFYDIHLLMTAENIDLMTEENITLLKDIFAAKEVSLDLLRHMPGQYEFHRLDWPAVKDSVSEPIQEFDVYFDFLLSEVNRLLQSLWIE